MKLSVVIPAYNEEENIKRGVLGDVYDYLKKQKYSWEVIVSDDGSTDDTPKLAQEQSKGKKGFRVIKNPHGGKPAALLSGIKKAKGEYTLFTDMDQSTPITELDKLMPQLERGFDVVIGSRGLSRKDFPLYRQIGAIVFLGIRKALILPEINDTQCGFKLFETSSLKKAFPKLQFFQRDQRVEGWKVTSYDVELLHILKKMGLKIGEVRVSWKDEDVSSSKGGGLSRYVRESAEMFGQILRVKINDLRGKYK